jgi:hypothetical protein
MTRAHFPWILLALPTLACGTAKFGAAPLDAGEDGVTADAGVPDDTPAACDAPLPASLPAVAPLDLDGYPPYAADGCAIVYVDVTGTLVALDLKSNATLTLDQAASSPKRPTIAGGVVAWEATDAGRAIVRVHTAAGTSTLAGAFDHAGEPRAAKDAVVFTAWLAAADASDTDVLLWDPTTGKTSVVFGGPGQQRLADVSRTHVAASDFSEDPDGTFNRNGTDLADVVVLERASGTVVHRAQPGKQAFPILVSATRLGYLDWVEVHPEPKLSQYTLRAGELAGTISGDVTIATVTDDSSEYVLPTGRGGILEWVDRPQSAPTALYRAPADLSSPPIAAPGLGGLTLHAPAGAGSFTLLATEAPTEPVIVLRGIAR